MVNWRRWTFGAMAALIWSATGQAAVPGKLGVQRMSDELAKELGIAGRGAPILWLVPAGPAKNAGLQSGDSIVAVDGKEVADFDQLVERLGGAKPGSKVALEFIRDGRRQPAATATLALWIGDVGDASYREALGFLRGVLARRDGPEIRAAIVDQHWKLGEREKALKSLEEAAAKFPDHKEFKVQRLDLLLKNGDYESYCRESIALADAYSPIVELQTEKAEALLASGRLTDAAAVAKSVVLATRDKPEQRDLQREAIQKWLAARLRTGKPLVDAEIDAAAQPNIWRHPALSTAGFWRERLGTRPIYQVTTGAKGAELKLLKANVLLGLVPNKMHGIAIKVNGVEVPLAIVDTGASHTLLGAGIAEEAGVDIGTSARAASGSLPFTARPAVVREIEIGGIVLKDVPINVGNPPPLVMTKAKAALGIDLMHHLRFVIDYPAEKVLIEPSSNPLPPADAENVWDIPLWTFTDHVLSVARTAKGGFARTLIDSGNFAQTLVWPQWAKQHVPNHPGPSSLLLYGFRNPQRQFDGLELGGVKLPKWPLMDIPPITLQGIDLLDLLMGHDLLSQYKVTIDMQNRRLRLESPGGKLQKPKTPRPFMT